MQTPMHTLQLTAAHTHTHTHTQKQTQFSMRQFPLKMLHPKCTKSRNLNSSVQIKMGARRRGAPRRSCRAPSGQVQMSMGNIFGAQIPGVYRSGSLSIYPNLGAYPQINSGEPKSQFEFVPRDTEESEIPSLDMVDFGDVAFSVETVTVICVFQNTTVENSFSRLFLATRNTRRRRCIGCLKLKVSFCKRDTNHRARSRKLTNEDKASYAFAPPCTGTSLVGLFLQNSH